MGQRARVCVLVSFGMPKPSQKGHVLRWNVMQRLVHCVVPVREGGSRHRGNQGEGAQSLERTGELLMAEDHNGGRLRIADRDVLENESGEQVLDTGMGWAPAEGCGER